uniref:Ca2: Cation Antiporter (CaCA) Family putative n=1 Tax=Albugo laibachii Nc14 TaxID=890382 RepID=F0W2R1_9STRA|nr:Ca2 :Cation Antiporter (CaCA) Family putative [Albugo laibachii Nc14]|eukprot:CCA15347.1 Ca2 :Cation Antiporter (CaCA) Family putative [Albugo laibachii Nc14]
MRAVYFFICSVRALFALDVSIPNDHTHATAPNGIPILETADSSRTTYFNYDTLLSAKICAIPFMAGFLLLLCLLFMFYLLSSTADSFFCPSLQSIVEMYRIPPDVAGATFLSFGNGSPDVFSNIAAFGSLTPRIGVASILGGGLLLTTVVTASVGLVSQNQLQLVPRKFMRDVVFYAIAVLYFCVVFYHGMVGQWQAIGFLIIYAIYVACVLLDDHVAVLLQPWFPLHSQNSCQTSDWDLVQSNSPSTLAMGSDSDQSMTKLHQSDDEQSNWTEETPFGPFSPHREEPYMYGTPHSDNSERSTFSLPTPRMNCPEPILSNAHSSNHEFLPLVCRRTTSLIASNRPLRSRRKRSQSTWQSLARSTHYGPSSRRWTRSYHNPDYENLISVSEKDEEEDSIDTELASIDDDIQRMCPSPITENETEEMTSPSKHLPLTRGRLSEAFHFINRYIWSPFQYSFTLIRRLTIPLLDEEVWDKKMTLCCPFFAILVIGTSVFSIELKNPVFVGFSIIGGSIGSIYVHLTSSDQTPPRGRYAAPYLALAFFMSVVWIMNIADEVVGILKTLGKALGVSQLVLGVSVLAWGNSVGDLISDVAIARDGFPSMAFAGCFAGPLFNLLVGTGTSLTIATFQHGTISMGHCVPLVTLGFIYLFISLALNGIVVASQKFRYHRRFCYILYAFYCSFVFASIAVVML